MQQAEARAEAARDKRKREDQPKPEVKKVSTGKTDAMLAECSSPEITFFGKNRLKKMYEPGSGSSAYTKDSPVPNLHHPDSRHGFTPPGSTAKASLTLARLLQPLRDRGPVRTNAYTYTVQRASLLPVEKRELVADKLHTGHAEEPKRTQSKPRGSCRRSRGRKRGVALRRHLTRNASSTAP